MNEYIFYLLVIAYTAHIIEEYILNWKRWVFDITNINIEWIDFFVINAGVIITGICLAVVGYKNPYISLVFPALMAINSIFFHILPTVIKRKYSPGLFTSILLFLPLSILAYYEAYKLNLLNLPLVLITIIGGGLVMSFPILLQMIKRELTK